MELSLEWDDVEIQSTGPAAPTPALGNDAPGLPISTRKRPLSVGTHFSGWESIGQSLASTGVEHRIKWTAETNSHCKSIISQNFIVDRMYGDVGSINFESLEPVDLFAAGSPCPSYSTAGKKQGSADPRGALLFKTTEFLRVGQPTCFLFEQVSNIRSKRFGAVWKQWLSEIKAAGYIASWKGMNSHEHGVPQNRPRVYICGIRKDCHSVARPFRGPKRLPKNTNLKAILDKKQGVLHYDYLKSDSKVLKRNIEFAMKKYPSWKSGSAVTVVDAQAGINFKHATQNYVPCITASRSKRGGFLLLRQRRWMTTAELGKCQGFDISVLNTKGVPETELRMMIGNSMTKSVLDRTLPRLLYSAGLLDEMPIDAWAH